MKKETVLNLNSDLCSGLEDFIKGGGITLQSVEYVPAIYEAQFIRIHYIKSHCIGEEWEHEQKDHKIHLSFKLIKLFIDNGITEEVLTTGIIFN